MTLRIVLHGKAAKMSEAERTRLVDFLRTAVAASGDELGEVRFVEESL